MQDVFVLHAGSVPGSYHTLPGRPRWHNNQDAYDLYRSENLYTAVVCDGCSGGTNSEVGANLTARLVTQQIHENVSAGRLPNQDVTDDQSEGRFWQKIRENVLAEIRVLANKMGGNFSQTINDYFLTTVLGLLVLPETTYVFAVGDGLCAVNDQLQDVTASAGNTPPYMTYALLNQQSFSEGDLQFTVRGWKTKEIDSVLLGTDGAASLPLTCDGDKQEDQGLSLLAITEDDQYAQNPDAIRRKLAAFNSASVSESSKGVQIAAGPLKDDTTIVLLSRKNSSGGDSNEGSN